MRTNTQHLQGQNITLNKIMMNIITAIKITIFCSELDIGRSFSIVNIMALLVNKNLLNYVQVAVCS